MKKGMALCIVWFLAAPALASEPGVELARGVSAWIGTLDAYQLRELRYAFDDEERFDLRLAPLRLEGLRGEDMDDAQWSAWLDALGPLLSAPGRRKLEGVMSLEREMARVNREGGLLRRVFGSFFGGERRYYASIYGEPAADAAWGLRFDGHHVSLNWTLVPGAEPSLTPWFLGAQPREVPEGWDRAGLRLLAEEEDRGIAVWNELEAEQREASELPFEFAKGLGGADRANFLGAGARIDPAQPEGIAYAELDGPARSAIDALIDTYLGNFPDVIAQEHRAAIDRSGRVEIHFAWSGSMKRGDPGYYRVQGREFLIEWDNTSPDADHVHTIYRNFEGDFGRDLLAQHRARYHTGVVASHDHP